MYHAILWAFLCSCIKIYTNKQQGARIKKSYIHKKTQKSFVTLLPMAESLASHGFHGNKIHILTLLPFVTASVFWVYSYEYKGVTNGNKSVTSKFMFICYRFFFIFILIFI
nr:MAG TPA: hypothetical protein [Caudoviricetes sp.]